MKFVNEHKDVRFILRPHPLMFKTMVKETDFSPEQVEQMKNNIINTENLILDEADDYITTLIETDILLSDSTSLIAEFFVTERPIVFCDTIDNYNEDGIKITNALYQESTWPDIENRLVDLLSGNDPDKEKRKSVIKEVMGENGGRIGIDIVDYIIKDYNNWKGKV